MAPDRALGRRRRPASATIVEDHYERFQEVQKLIDAGSITTWAGNPKVGHWQAADLKTADL